MTTIAIGSGCAVVALGLTIICLLALDRRSRNRKAHRLGRWLGINNQVRGGKVP